MSHQNSKSVGDCIVDLSSMTKIQKLLQMKQKKMAKPNRQTKAYLIKIQNQWMTAL